ncbi:unnamed protein product, partial [Cylicostephanus goldi]
PISKTSLILYDFQVAELKADCVLRGQQGTYQCVASNEHDLTDERAGPPRFLRCLGDIWMPLGEEVVLQVEVAGYPAPDLIWYHQDKRVVEGKNVKINYTSETVCELRISDVTLRDLGSYAVEASNVHGLVKTTCFLNAGEPRHAEPPQFQQIEAPEIAVQPKVAFHDSVKKSASTMRMEMRKKGAPPNFIQGLEDMELQAGDSAAVAGKLSRKHRHRHGVDLRKTLKSSKLDARSLAAAIMADMQANGNGDTPRHSIDESKHDGGEFEESFRHIGTVMMKV